MLLHLPSKVSSLLKIGVTTLVMLSLGDVNQFARAQSASPSCEGVQLGGINQPVVTIVASRRGFFASEGINVCFNQASGSTALFNDLFAGRYDLVTTTADNVVNRVVNSNLPLELVAGFDRGSDLVLAVNTELGINSIADLRGLPIAVDAPDSGFVLALRKILGENGLFLENGDYSLQQIGGTSVRYRDLAAGQTPTNEPVYATILNYPFTVISTAQAPNIRILERLSDYVSPYQATSLATTSDYAATSGDTITAFIRAYIKAGQFVADPANREAVIADLAAALNVPLDVAALQLDAVLAETSGVILDAQLDEQGLINAINLRQEFGGLNRVVDSEELGKPGGGLYNDQYWRAAINSLFPVTPTPVPEPTSALGLLAFAAGGTISVLKRCQKN